MHWERRQPYAFLCVFKEWEFQKSCWDGAEQVWLKQCYCRGMGGQIAEQSFFRLAVDRRQTTEHAGNQGTPAMVFHGCGGGGSSTNLTEGCPLSLETVCCGVLKESFVSVNRQCVSKE